VLGRQGGMGEEGERWRWNHCCYEQKFTDDIENDHVTALIII